MCTRVVGDNRSPGTGTYSVRQHQGAASLQRRGRVGLGHAESSTTGRARCGLKTNVLDLLFVRCFVRIKNVTFSCRQRYREVQGRVCKGREHSSEEKWYVCTFVYGEKGACVDGVRVVTCFACISFSVTCNL